MNGARKPQAMRVLITNIEMRWRSGTTLYVRDLALELKRRGHEPAVFTLATGGIADELRQAGVPVATSLRHIRMEPDIIHGHHHPVTCAALRHYPGLPAIFICHDHTSPFDEPPLHPRILKYLAVSRVCLERVKGRGIAEETIELLQNFVDTRRFLPRLPLPSRPRRALVFSNYAKEGTYLPAVREACRMAGLELDIVGEGVGRPVERPEEILGNYDLVFAKAKAAMEAMAVGTAVILCDFSGAGPMVTSREFATLEPLNFGFQALCNPLRPEVLAEQIARYDAEDAAKVRDLLRGSHRLDRTAERLVGIYSRVVTERASSAHETGARPSCRPSFREDAVLWTMRILFLLKKTLKGLPGYPLLKKVFLHAARVNSWR